MKSVKAQIRDPIIGQVLCQTRFQVTYRIWSQIERQVWNQVYLQVSDQVFSQVRNFQ